jgi:predicted RNA binding protein YcfA (HicA-like mRNA interferase family)
MAGHPTITLKDVRRKLKLLGYEKKRSSKHEIWEKGGNIVPLSHGNDDVGSTLLRSIYYQLGMSKKDFLDLQN